MRKTLIALFAAVMLFGAMAAPAAARGKNNPHPAPVVYVTSQGLAYDSIVLTELPYVPGAPYQKLEPGGPTGLQTEWGPGDQGFVGGRWWMDTNANGVQDADDAYFMCPLLGPGFVPAA